MNRRSLIALGVAGALARFFPLVRTHMRVRDPYLMREAMLLDLGFVPAGRSSPAAVELRGIGNVLSLVLTHEPTSLDGRAEISTPCTLGVEYADDLYA